MLAGNAPSCIPWNISWREQLRGRDRDAVVPSPAPLAVVTPEMEWEAAARRQDGARSPNLERSL
jgi:hypothetical protein